MSLKVVVMACERAGLRRERLPEGAVLLPVPCSGRVSVPLVLHALCQGADGFLVLGRHEQTCRLAGAEEPARRRTRQASELLALAGLGKGRARFVVPASGEAGPVQAVERFLDEVAALGENPLKGVARPDELPSGEGLHAGLGLMRWLGAIPGLRPNARAFLEAEGLVHPGPSEGAQGPRLFAGEIACLQLLGEDLWGEPPLTKILHDSLDILGRLLRQPASVWAEGCRQTPLRIEAVRGPVYGLGAPPLPSAWESVDQVLLRRGSELPRPPGPGLIATTGGPEAESLIEVLGHRALRVDRDPLPDCFSFTSDQRREAEEMLVRAEAAGAVALLVSDPLTLARFRLLTRQGAWRRSRIRPIMAASLAHLATQGKSLGSPSEAPPWTTLARRPIEAAR